jgi:hypothetical protein
LLGPITSLAGLKSSCRVKLQLLCETAQCMYQMRIPFLSTI